MPDRLARTLLSGGMGILVVVLSLPVTADTVILKNGGRVKDCRVLKKDDENIHLRTRDGEMAIPRHLVKRIVKKQTVFDVYDGKVGRVKEDDHLALYNLATWCQGQGLRKEMYAHLRQVLELAPDHLQTRHLLGYVRDGEGWTKLPPLSVEILLKKENLREKVRKNLSMFVGGRGDIKIVENVEDVPDIHACRLRTEVSIGRSGSSSFYGMQLQKPVVSALTKMSVEGKLGRGKSLSVKGEVLASMSNPSDHAIGDSFMRNSRRVHAFFDRIQRQRIRIIETARGGGSEPPPKKPGSVATTPATP